VLRREAEAMVLPSLAAFLQGTHEPKDNDERLALLGICQFQGGWAAAARLYAGAFAADPLLADRLTADCLRRTRGPEQPADLIELFNAASRYHAARCAALAGRGLGKDAGALGVAEQMHWRIQARKWLEADLAAWAAMLSSDSRVDCDLARQMLTQWQVDPDLEGLREPSALENLAPAEREACRKLWKDVDHLMKRARHLR
jgi:serine/threonine-protein kinase